jgi:hypothetical protein
MVTTKYCAVVRGCLMKSTAAPRSGTTSDPNTPMISRDFDAAAIKQIRNQFTVSDL